MSEIPFTIRPPRETLRRKKPARRRASRLRLRAGRLLALVLVGLGALVLIDAGVTLLWQEPFTALYAKFRRTI